VERLVDQAHVAVVAGFGRIGSGGAQRVAVCARAEVPALAADHRRAHRPVRVDGGRGVDEFARHRDGERVAALRREQRDDGDAAADLQTDFSHAEHPTTR